MKTMKKLCGAIVFVSLCSVALAAPPVANDQSIGPVGPGREIWFYLSYSGSPTNFTILTNPRHGTLRSIGQSESQAYFAYTANAGYEGPDSFTWLCRNASGSSGTATCSITVSTVPRANNQSSTVGARGELLLFLSYTDPMHVATTNLVFTILSGPTHGTLESYNARHGTNLLPHVYFYRPTGDYTGADSFTWRLNNGFHDSNVATNTITVRAAVPVPRNQSEFVPPNMPSVIRAAYTGGGGFSNTLQVLRAPSHGSVAVSGDFFTYTPATNFTGVDSFTWRVRYVNETTPATNTLTVTCSLVVRDGIRGAAYDQKVVAIRNNPVRVAFAHGFRPAPAFLIVTPPAHGTVTASGAFFTYSPATNFTGTDEFTWMMNDGTANSNIATNRILVRAENSRGGMLVLLVVRDTLLPEITHEVHRWKADLEREGYTAKITPWSSTSASDLWFYLVEEYFTPGQFVAGATLIGNLPTATGLTTDQTTDYALMNMLHYRDNGWNKQHIWISRIYTVGMAGGEVRRAKWAMDANHGYRTGTHRLPHNAYWDDHAYDAVEEANPANALIVWPTIERLHPKDAFRRGGEFQNSEIHGDDAFRGWTFNSSQLRYSIHSSCGPGRLGGPVNRNTSTYGGGLILSVGSSSAAFSLQNVVMDDVAYFRALAAGDTFGNGMTRLNLNPYRDFDRNMFYGDLSLPARAAPSNAVPVIAPLTASAVSGVAPLTVNFAVTASDPDGTIVAYEWFPEGFTEGTAGPALTGLATNFSQTFTSPRRYVAEAQAVDNFKARAWATRAIIVSPTRGRPLRVQCGMDFSEYREGWDYTDLATNLWLHDHRFADGTWGYSDGEDAYVAQAVAGTEDDLLYQRFRTGASFTYRVPVANGGHWLRLHFADMQSTAAGQRVLDVTAEGILQVSGLDVHAQVGARTATTVERSVNVTDGELTFTVARNPASVSDVFLNAFEVIPHSAVPTVAVPATANPATVTGTNTVLSVLGADDGGEPALTYTWAATGAPPAPVTFSVNGNNAARNTTATFTKAGSYSFQVVILDTDGLSVTSSVGVTVNATFTGVTLVPATAFMTTSATQQFVATAHDQFGTALATQPPMTWTVSGGGTIGTGGLFTATTVGGPFTVTATSGARSGTASVTVTGVDAHGIPDWWKILNFGSPTTPGSDALADPDGDGVPNYREYRDGTDPTDPLSRVSYNVVPYAESFEDLAGWGGAYGSVLGRKGWHSSAPEDDRSRITNLLYTISISNRPLPSATHTNVLRLDTPRGSTLSNSFGAGFDMRTAQTYFDMIMQFVPRMDRPVECTVTDTGLKFAAYINVSSNLTLYHGVAAANGTILSNTVTATTRRIDTAEWYRLTVTIDATATGSAVPLAMYQVKINGVTITNAAGYADGWKAHFNASGQLPPTSVNGTWFRTASDTGIPRTLSSVAFGGTGYLDELVVTTDDPFAAFHPTHLLTVARTGRGRSSLGLRPLESVSIMAGGRTQIVYTADDWYRIGALTSNGAPVSAAAGARVFTQALVNVAAAISNHVTFAEATPAQTGHAGVPTAWLKHWREADVRSGRDAFDVRTKYLLGLDPTVSNTFHLAIESINVTGNAVRTTVRRTVTGNLSPDGQHGHLKLMGARSPGGPFTNLVGTARTGSAVFDGTGRRTYTNTVEGASQFFLRAIIE